MSWVKTLFHHPIFKSKSHTDTHMHAQLVEAEVGNQLEYFRSVDVCVCVYDGILCHTYMHICTIMIVCYVVFGGLARG